MASAPRDNNGRNRPDATLQQRGDDKAVKVSVELREEPEHLARQQQQGGQQ